MTGHRHINVDPPCPLPTNMADWPRGGGGTHNPFFPNLRPFLPRGSLQPPALVLECGLWPLRCFASEHFPPLPCVLVRSQAKPPRALHVHVLENGDTPGHATKDSVTNIFFPQPSQSIVQVGARNVRSPTAQRRIEAPKPHASLPVSLTSFQKALERDRSTLVPDRDPAPYEHRTAPPAKWEVPAVV